ncbi:testis-expressed protein 33-like isoform X2 [Myxocyprinus asiaticus]|uniref:testis-expressed protein 33-like isoform X2 n=1 Tax=Myxocyprinus asiaticus TaxID=70543 RepID=UPI002223D7F4|nr:testis-expressed protein 33-like isoform X2 [Myxocyprinus asiaticus]
MSTNDHSKDVNSKNQVSRVLCPQVPPLCAPHYSDTGPPVVWSSLVKDSYVRHPPSAFVHDPEHWHGHKTDYLVKWTEQNLLEKQLHKLLKEMEGKGVSK